MLFTDEVSVRSPNLRKRQLNTPKLNDSALISKLNLMKQPG